jgi:hypothetical protein
MTENLLQTIQHLIQDIVAPEVRETKAEVKALREYVNLRFDSLNEKIDAQFKVLLATLGETRARNELVHLQFKSEIGERLAVLESKRR